MLIAICDDERRELERLTAVLTDAGEALDLPVRVAAYASGEDLSAAVEAGERPDMAILDVYLAGISGVETARRLRRTLPQLPLAFLTASRDFALDAFAVDALHYLIKPVTGEGAEELLRRLLSRRGMAARSLALSNRKERRRYPLGRLRYLLSRDKGVELYLSGGREWFPCAFRQAAEQLSGQPDFLQISRGCIVNLNDVLYLGRTSFHMKEGESLPVSRRERPAVQERYNDFLFRRMDQAGEGQP